MAFENGFRCVSSMNIYSCGKYAQKEVNYCKKTYRVCRLILSYEVGTSVINNQKLLTIKRDEVLVNSRIILSITDWRVNIWYNCCLNNWVATWLHRAVILNYHFQYQISLQQSKKKATKHHNGKANFKCTNILHTAHIHRCKSRGGVSVARGTSTSLK